jgi:hypothetical protein
LSRHQTFRFIFFEDFTSNTSIVDVVFALSKLKATSKVAVLKMLQNGKLAFYSYDFFGDMSKRDNSHIVELRYIWSISNTIESLNQIFTSQNTFKGRHFTIAANPWSHHVLGSEIPKEEGGTSTNMYRNYWGYEIDLLVEISSVLDFTYTIVNPADGLWGNIGASGKWLGLVGEASMGSVDFVMSDVLIMYYRHQVLDSTIRFDRDFLTFATPLPQPLPKFMALYQPFHLHVWLAVAAALSISAVAFTLIAYAEERILGIYISCFSTIGKAGWYCFGSMLGESGSGSTDTESKNTHALR